MVEKPMTLSIPSAERIIAAERAAHGCRVFVGYMRRYAATFLTFKREIESIPRILYARSRDFSGPNAKFVSESATFPKRFVGDIPSTAERDRKEKIHSLMKEAFPNETSITPEHVEYAMFLGGLGSHDLSLMREVLGLPKSVCGVSVNTPFYSAMLNYYDPDGRPFSVTYESGIDGVPDFDAHLAVYGEKKRVTISYDSPYVKGLPIKVKVEELNDDGEFQTREILGSYEDAYTSEMTEMYECLVNGKTIKTTAEDAMQDLQLFDMMFERWIAQRQTCASAVNAKNVNGH